MLSGRWEQGRGPGAGAGWSFQMAGVGEGGAQFGKNHWKSVLDIPAPLLLSIQGNSIPALFLDLNKAAS